MQKLEELCVEVCSELCNEPNQTRGQFHFLAHKFGFNFVDKIKWCLFAWQTKFGEIDPMSLL